MTVPRKYDGWAAPEEIVALVGRLVPQLVSGDDPALIALQEQFRVATIAEVEMTGCGFYVDFSIPSDAPRTTPLNFAGGNAEIVLERAPLGAGCVLFVKDGRLATLEGYTFGDEWAEGARVLAVKNVQPIVPKPTG